jgi:TadE-like protein
MSMRFFRALAKRFRRDENGAVTVEFVILFPFYIFLFCSAFEVGMYLLRQILLDRGLDETVRNLRLGVYPASWATIPTRDNVRLTVCDNTPIIADCSSQLNLELIDINDFRASRNSEFTKANSQIECRNRGVANFVPSSDWNPGSRNHIIVIRACWFYKPFFNAFTIAQLAPLKALQDSKGGVPVFATSAFAVEP